MKKKNKEKNTLYRAGEAALKKIAGESLFQYTTLTPPPKVEQDEEQKAMFEKLGAAITAKAAQDNGVERPNAAKPAKKQETETPPPKKEEKASVEPVEVVDWQATAKVMQSVASVALELMRELEMEATK